MWEKILLSSGNCKSCEASVLTAPVTLALCLRGLVLMDDNFPMLTMQLREVSNRSQVLRGDPRGNQRVNRGGTALAPIVYIAVK